MHDLQKLNIHFAFGFSHLKKRKLIITHVQNIMVTWDGGWDIKTDRTGEY